MRAVEARGETRFFQIENCCKARRHSINPREFVKIREIRG